MNREEALNKTIGILTYHQVNFCKSKEAVANMNEIIEALEKIDQECVADKDTNVPTTDCISREAVIKTIAEWFFSKEFYYTNASEYLRKRLDELPSVSPMPKMGVWVEIDEDPHETWECDKCGFVIDGSGCVDPYEYRDTYKYCPNCGAKMGEQEGNREG